MKSKRSKNAILWIALQVLCALAPAALEAQVQTTRVTLSLEYFLYDLEADCRVTGFDFPEQYIDWSMVQGLTVVADRTDILRESGSATIDDPRRPRQTCPPWAIGAGADRWVPVQDVLLSGTFDSNGPPIVVTIEMFDDDGSNDDRLDLTQGDGSTVTFTIDPRTHIRSFGATEPFCNTPDAGCTDSEGQWCGACNDAQTCCNDGNFDFNRGYAFRGDGRGAGISWRIELQRFECTARRDVDSDGDGLLDDWELFGKDSDCNGSFDMPFNSWGANPRHKDIFVEYDACFGQRISRQGIDNLKRVFANAPIDAGGVANPDGLPGINVHVDTGTMFDPQAHEGVGTCGDGRDNDGVDGTDLADPDCLLGKQEAAGTCSDGLDNDGNGLIDGAEPSCRGRDANNSPIVAFEGRRGNCADGVSNNDGDSAIDANDPQCRLAEDFSGGGFVMCPAQGMTQIEQAFLDVKASNFDPRRQGLFRYVLRWPRLGNQNAEDGVPNACANGVDESLNGFTDGADALCMFMREDGAHIFGGPGDCYDGVDNDLDGASDAMDGQCDDLVEVPSVDPRSCHNGIDDGDGMDFDDPECTLNGAYNDGHDNIAIFEDDDSGLAIVHELGHSLGLHHAGNTAEPNFKPNYLSVMNYLYGGGIPQDPDAMMENAHLMTESPGGQLGSCVDRIDNDADGLIDALDWNCRASCRDGIDNDNDGHGTVASRDHLDPDCRGIDIENDGIAELVKLDFSPPLMHSAGDRSVLLPSIAEQVVFESNPFVNIDINNDEMQDQWADALNMIRFRRYRPGFAEGAGRPVNSCSDGRDNDNSLASDHFDSLACRTPAPLAGLLSYFTLPRTGERTVSAHPPALTWLPQGFDFNADGDTSDILMMDMDEDADPRNDRDDSLGVLTDFDDWRNIRFKTTVRNAGSGPGPGPAHVHMQEPSAYSAVQLITNSRPADLVIDSATTRLVPSSSGASTLAVEVENIEPTDAYGTVSLVLSGLPAGAAVSATGGYCVPEHGNIVCVRSGMRGHEVWTLSFALQAELCSWRSGITLSVKHSGGVELNPEDNTLAIEVGGSGIWSQWRQCPSHWGASDYAGPSTLGTPTVVWSGAEILNTPVIDAAGDIYLADAGGYVRKLAPNGTSRWVSAQIGVVHAGPALTPAGHIVVATEDGRIRGLSQATGAQVWSYQTGSNVYASIVVAGDRLYATTEFGLGFADQLLAFNVDGTFLWARDLGGPITSAPTIGADGTIYVAVETAYFVPGKIVAVNPNNTERWSRNLDGHVRYSPVQRNGKVYVGTSTRRVYAFDALTGVQAWMYTVPCGAWEACEVSGTPAALPNNQLAVGVGGGRVHVIRDNGTSVTLLRSIPPTGVLLGGPRDAIIVGSNGIAYVGNQNAQLRALNLAAGTQVSLATMNGNAVGSVALDGQGRLYVGTDTGRLYRYP